MFIKTKKLIANGSSHTFHDYQGRVMFFRKRLQSHRSRKLPNTLLISLHFEKFQTFIVAETILLSLLLFLTLGQIYTEPIFTSTMTLTMISLGNFRHANQLQTKLITFPLYQHLLVRHHKVPNTVINNHFASKLRVSADIQVNINSIQNAAKFGGTVNKLLICSSRGPQETERDRTVSHG